MSRPDGEDISCGTIVAQLRRRRHRVAAIGLGVIWWPLVAHLFAEFRETTIMHTLLSGDL